MGWRDRFRPGRSRPQHKGLQRDVTTLLSFRDQVLDLGSLPRMPSPPAEPPWRPDRQPPWKGRDSGFSGSRDAMAALRTRPATTPSTPTPAAPSSSPILPPATPSVPPTNEEPPSPVSPVSPGSDSGLKSSEAGSRWHDATHSGASGNSTSGVGTSVGAGISGGCVATSGDELLGLLDTIASRGRMIADENRQLAEVLSHTESLSQQAERDRLDQDRLDRERLDHSRLDQDRLDQERSPDVTFRCRYCERPFPVRPGAGTDPTRLLMRDPVTDALNMHVQMGGATMGGQSPLLGGHGPLLGGQLGAHSPLLGGQSPLLGQTPHLGQSPLLGGQSPLLERQSPVLGGQSPYLGARNHYLGGQPPLFGGQYLAGGGGRYPLGLLTDTTPQHPGISTPLRRSPPPGAGCPLSLPTFRHPREEAIPALTELEKLIQERQVLTERLLGMELVAVRSQGQVASLQTRLHAVTTANEELRRQLRLNPPTLDSRLQDPSQHPTRQRRSQPSPAGASGVGAGVGAARSTPDLRPPSRIPQPMSLRRRPETGSEKDVSGRASGRSRYTQTGSDGLSRDEKGSQTDQTGSVDESGGVASFRRQTDPEREGVAGFLRNTDPGVRDGDRAAGFLGATSPARVPDRDRVAGILRETDPLRLQRQLLRMLVEAEVLRSQLSALGHDRSRTSVFVSNSSPSAEDTSSLAETPTRTKPTDRRPGSEDPSLSRHQPSETPRRRPAPRPVDRSLGHSSIPVLVRSASPARGVARRRGSGGGNTVGSGDGSGVGSGVSTGVSNAGRQRELATVRAIRLLPGTLRRSTPNLSTGEGQSYGRTDGPASQTGLQTSQAKSQASLTNGRASRTSGQTRNQSGLASQNITWANKTNSQTAYHNSRATNEPGNQASPASNPTGSRSPDKPTQSPSASQLSPASQIFTSTRLSAASPSSAPQSTGLSGSHQDPKTKGDWRVSFPNVTRSGNSSPSSPASSTSSPSRIPLPQSPGLASTALSASQPSPSSGSLARTAADIRALRRDMERRLRASRSDPDSAVGGVDELATEAAEASGLRVEGVDVSSDDSTTSGMTASETRAMAKDKDMETRTETAAAETSEGRSRNRALPPQAPERRGGLLERLNALDSATATAGGSRFGYRHTGGSQPDPALMPPSQGLIHQILTAHTTPSQCSGFSGAGSDGGGNIGGSGGTTRRHHKLQKSVSLSPSGGQSPVAQRTRGSVSLAPSGGRQALTRSATLRESGSGQAPRQAPAKESGNARVGRYIRSLLQRISEVPDQ